MSSKLKYELQNRVNTEYICVHVNVLLILLQKKENDYAVIPGERKTSSSSSSSSSSTRDTIQYSIFYIAM